MKFGVVIFPGSNCDHDMLHVLSTVYGQEVEEIWHKEYALNNFTSEDCIILPGGFSYGDYLRSGAIASFSHIMKSVISFAENGGKVWGICNGFQILCEAGLLPGTLLRNRDKKFICKNVYLRTETSNSLLTNQLSKGDVLKIPIAHAEGRYFCDNATLDVLKQNDQILFRYCDDSGVANEASNFNGSLENIAGICNSGRNVFGMMPHPERAAETALGNDDGRHMFESLLQSVGV
jgi:phosphoribosylformylglycinamidine synthase